MPEAATAPSFFHSSGFGVELALGNIGLLAGLQIANVINLEILVGHGLGQRRRTSFGFGQAAQGIGARKLIAFWGTKWKNESLVPDDRAGIADSRLRGHEDLVAAQRYNRRPADRVARNVGHGVRPVQFLQVLGDLQAFHQPPAGAVDLQDHQVGALLLGGIQLAVKIRFSARDRSRPRKRMMTPW